MKLRFNSPSFKETCTACSRPPEAGIRYGRRPAALARTHAGIRYGRRLAALTRDKVPPQAGRTCEQSMRRPAALARTHAGIRYACTAARRGNVQPPAGRAHTAARRTAGGRDKVRPILISCEHSLLAGEAWFETKVCIRRENSCTQSMVRDQSMHSERESMHAGHASCLHSCARSAGVGWGWEGG